MSSARAEPMIDAPERDGSDAPLATLPASLLQSEVARIAASTAFRTSPRHRRFLDYLVAHALRADGSRLKEITLGIEVFDRNAGTFDPQRDTIVRVEARRLRSRLARYYAGEGATSLIEIVLPVGAYTPIVRRRAMNGIAASLAVLPMQDRTTVPAVVAPFCDDLFDALIDAVARVPGFTVIARTSAIAAAGASGPVDSDRASDVALSRRLSVAVLLRGIVDQHGDELRLKLTLVRGTDGARLWTGTWTWPVDGDFAARDRLTAQIVGDVQIALHTRLPEARRGDAAAATAAPSQPLEPVDERARDLVDRGRYLMRYGTVDAYPQALQRFRAAAALAPRYAAAHFGIARSLSYLIGMTQIAPDEGVEEARRAASEALSLDPLHGDAASLLAAIQQRFDLDWQSAQAGYLSAIALAPGSLYVHFNYAFGLMFSGRFDEAEAELRLARELDPLDIGQRATHALLRIYRRDYAGAEATLAALVDDEPRHLLAHSLRGALHLYHGDPEHALVEYAIAKALAPTISIGAVGTAQAHAMAGRRAAAVSERDALVAAFSDRYLSPYQLALIDLKLEDLDSAFAALERSAAERDPNFIAVLVDPSLDAARADPRYAALLARHGLDSILPASAGDDRTSLEHAVRGPPRRSRQQR